MRLRRNFLVGESGESRGEKRIRLATLTLWGMTKPRLPLRHKPARTQTHKPLATAREIAEIVGVSTWTVYNWARSKRIPVIRATDRIIRFDADAVLAALEGGRK